MMGGLWAVMITDIVQFVILIVVVFVVLPIGLDKIGWLSHPGFAAPEGFYRIFHAFDTHEGYFTIWFFAAMWVMTPLLYNGSFSLVQRYTTVPTPRDAKKSAWLSMSLGLVFFPFIWWKLVGTKLDMRFHIISSPKKVYTNPYITPIMYATFLPLR